MTALILPALIDFFTPLFLAGAAAMAIPLVIHLLARQRAPERPFSTLRFLRRSVEKTARRRRFRDVLLMLVRMAVVGFLAFALSRPFLTGAGGLFRDRTTAVAIVLDNSPSMGLADGGDVRFERARAAALRVLDLLQENDQAAVILTSGATRRQGEMYRQIENVERLVEDASLGMSAADLPAALAEARRVLGGSDAPNTELFVITDLQQSNWQLSSTSSDSNGDESDEAKTPLLLVDVHRERPVNVALESVDVRTAVPAVGLPMEITASVRNAAPSPQSLQLELVIGDALINRPPAATLAAGEVRSVAFDYLPTQAGIQVGRVKILGDDASELDNERAFVIDTQSPVQVALVDQRKDEEAAHRSASYYLERALQPTQSGTYAIEVTSLKPELLAEEPLSSYAVLICADLPPLAEAAVDAIEDFVRRGGLVLWSCGPNTDPAALTTLAREDRLFVGEFSYPDADQAAGAHWAYLDDSHPVLAPLADPPSLYRAVTVDHYLKLTLTTESSARVLVRLANGDPVLTVQSVGAGQVWMLTCGAHASWTTLPLRPVFVPLINRLVLASAEREHGPLEVAAGRPARLSFPDESGPVTVELTTPGAAEPTRLTTTDDGGVQRLNFEETQDVGVYTARTIDAQHPRQFSFAVNPASEESDPATVPEGDLEKLCGQPVLLVHDVAELNAAITRLREGTPLMDLFLIVVLVIAVFEVLLANRLGSQEPLARPLSSAERVRNTLRRAQSLHQLNRYSTPGRARLR